MGKIFFLLLAFSSLVAAQRSDTARLQLGLRAGVGFHEVDFLPITTVETLEGTEFGLVLRYFESPLVGFQAEVSYVEAGWAEPLPGLEANYERRVNYAELQLLTQLSVGRGRLQPLIQAGPYLSAPLSEEETLPAGFDPTAFGTDVYYGRELPFRLNFGVQGGLGFNVELGRLTVQVDGRYRLGFSDLIRTGETQAVTSRRQGFGGGVALLLAL